MEINQINVLGQTYNIRDAFGKALIASEFNPATLYVNGDLVQHNNILYSCINNTSGTWNVNNWSQIYITDLLVGDKQIIVPSEDWSLITQIFNKTISGSFYCEVDKLGANILRSCSSLTQVDLPYCLGISRFALGENSNLFSINLPKCNYLADYAFIRCISLSQITLPMCSFVGYGVFAECASLSQVSLPACTFIDQYAFAECTSLEQLFLLSPTICTLSSIKAFLSTPMVASSYLGYYGSIYVPYSLVDEYKTATNWIYFSDRIVGGDF